MSQKRRGPRGGTTTTTPGGLRRKVFYLDEEEAQELRRRAFEAEVTESELVRKALRQASRSPSREGRVTVRGRTAYCPLTGSARRAGGRLGGMR